MSVIIRPDYLSGRLSDTRGRTNGGSEKFEVESFKFQLQRPGLVAITHP